MTRKKVTFTLDGVATGNDQVIFDGQTITFTNGMTPGDLADAFQAQYSAVPLANRNWTVTSITPWGQVNLESKALANVSNLTANAFQFVDDTNIGTPSLGVAVTTQGSASSVTLNNFTSGSTLTLENQDGTHIVNVQNNTAADVFNLVTGADGNLGSVTANWAETVNIDTLGGPGSDTLVRNDTSAKTITATGGDDLTIDTDSTKISLFDASSLGGKLTWAADANTVAITVKTGSGGSDVDFSAIAIPGLAPITFLGGSGADEVTLGDLGASRANITLGVGADIVHVGLVDGGNDYSSVLDFNVAVDKLSFAGGGTLQAQDQVLEPTAEFQDYLDQAADGAAGEIHFFHWNGDTYVVKDNTNGEDFQDASDTVIRLQGLLTLTPTNFI